MTYQIASEFILRSALGKLAFERRSVDAVRLLYVNFQIVSGRESLGALIAAEILAVNKVLSCVRQQMLLLESTQSTQVTLEALFLQVNLTVVVA